MLAQIILTTICQSWCRSFLKLVGGMQGYFSRLVSKISVVEIEKEAECDRKQMEFAMATRVREIRHEERELAWMVNEDKNASRVWQ